MPPNDPPSETIEPPQIDLNVHRPDAKAGPVLIKRVTETKTLPEIHAEIEENKLENQHRRNQERLKLFLLVGTIVIIVFACMYILYTSIDPTERQLALSTLFSLFTGIAGYVLGSPRK